MLSLIILQGKNKNQTIAGSVSLKKYINVIKEYSFSKIDFKKNEDTLFKYYSIKVIIKYNDFGSSKVIYEVYNNDSQIEI